MKSVKDSEPFSHIDAYTRVRVRARIDADKAISFTILHSFWASAPACVWKSNHGA